jgi:hypothetical protein
MSILLKDLKQKYSQDLVIQNQLKNEFGDYKELEKEYDEWWENILLPEIISQSSNGNGQYAGAGPVDYNEGKILYLFLRNIQPSKVLEIGFASGVSSTIIARALELNNKGVLHTVDFKSDPFNHKWIIDQFKVYIKNGLIKPTYPKDGVEFIEENKNENYEVVFSDGSHELDFCDPVANLLNKYFPNALHLYHEWSFSSLSPKVAKDYLAIPNNLQHQAFAERISFEKHFPFSEYEHYGFYGSCGLGVVKKRKTDINMKIYYRLSNLEAGISKKKIPNATKQHCLENCITEFGKENITILGDRLNNETRDYVESLNLKLIEVNNGSGAGTFRDALDLAVKENKDSDLVYLLEDDFLHKPNSKNLLIEGLSKYNAYITLYDHPDKYLNKENGGNPFIEQEGEVTRLVKTDSIHWKITNSTVMSFAAKISRLKDDYDLLLKYSSQNITDSFRFFMELNQTKGIPVLSSVPGYSTHCESAWLSPLTNWNKI